LYYIQNLLGRTNLTPQPPLLEGEGEQRSELNLDQKIEIAYEFQNAVSDVLVHKTKKAMREFGIQTLIVAGGVSANKKIISDLQTMVEQEFPETKFLAPARELTGDNALMIALAGYFKIQKNPDADYADIRAVGNLSFRG
jgi:N6-L-threonylcarbamoyladenine synthase